MIEDMRIFRNREAYIVFVHAFVGERYQKYAYFPSVESGLTSFGAIAQTSPDCDFEKGMCYTQDSTDTFDWTWDIANSPLTDHTTTVTSGSTFTTAGNGQGAPCVFPFTYSGTKYSSCITSNHNYRWCSTTSNYDKDAKWGNCLPSGIHSLGCYVDKWQRSLPTYLGSNGNKADLINWCYGKAKQRGFKVFGVQNGGECWSGSNAHLTYNKYGPKTSGCQDGLGGGWGNDVYIIRGWFAIINKNSLGSNEKARIISPSQSSTGANSNCLTFWYYMYGPKVGTLNVYLNSTYNASLGYPVFQRSGSQSPGWNMGEVNIQQTYGYSIVFEGQGVSSFRGSIAIDDIKMSSGACPAIVGVCAFETDNCGFTQATDDDFDWRRHRGGTATPGTGPLSDHTLGSRQGYYFYAEVNNQRNGDKARMSKKYKKTSPSGRCLEFWYMMYGRELGDLNVYLKPDGGALGAPIFNTSGDAGLGRTWLKAQVTLNSTVDFSACFSYAKNPLSFRLGSRAHQGRVQKVMWRLMMSKSTMGSVLLTGDCDFQGGFCTWRNSMVGDDFDWIRARGSTATTFTGPSTDRFGTASGYYVFIETSNPRNTGDKARIYSKTFTASSPRCFTFWYHMYGATIGSLNIYQRTSGRDSLIWTQSGEKGNRWLSGQVTVGNAASYQIVIEGIRGTSYTGDIAIDDFVFLDGISCSIVPSDAGGAITTPPTTPLITTTQPVNNLGINCDFEKDFCPQAWSQDVTDTFNWTRQSGSTSSSGTGPSVDHTLGTAQGYYIYIETSYPRKFNDTARIISSSVPGTTGTPGKCLSFWYHMYGATINRLNVLIRTGSHDTPLWSKLGARGDKWIRAQVTVSSRTHFQVVFEAITGKDYQGDIALDDITLSDGACNVLSTTCTFEESHICGYMQDTTDNFNWNRGSGATVSSGTGPSADHTLGTAAGFYMYIETSSPVQPGWKARLIGGIQPRTYSSCLTFWYHMYGSTIGTLNVYSKTSSLGSPIWTKIGNQGKEWLVAQVTVRSAWSQYQIVFEGVRGSSYTGDIAIDDISLIDGQCPNPGTCDFENGLCTYRNDMTEDNFDWLQGKGNTLSSGTGPSTDHTTGNGNGTYMFIESSSPRRPGDKARLVSQSFDTQPSQGRCMQFWYHMNGADIGTLNVIWKTGPGNQSESVLWTLSGNQQNNWLFARVSLPRLTNVKHFIVFEAIRGNSYQGDIAIDDLQLTTGTCGILPSGADPNKPTGTPSPTPTTAFTTPPPIPKGDFNCDFEAGFCKYDQEHLTDVFNWTRTQGDTYSADTGPLYDHTIQLGVTPGPNGPGSIQQILSGKCLHINGGAFKRPASGTQLVYYDGCGQKRLEFEFSAGLWKHTPFGMCVSRRGGSNSATADDVVLTDTCVDNWQMTAGGSLKHMGSGKCVTPFNNYKVPPNNLKLVLSSTCDDSSNKQKMRWSPSLGYYAFIEASSPRKQNDTARLVSQASISSNPSPGKCLNFWFHMYGPHIGSLNLYLKRGSNLGNPIWSRSGTHGNRWNNAIVPITQSGTFQIVFEGVRGSSYKGDIALDDVQLKNGACQFSMDCDFENVQPPQYCGWTNSKSDNFDWTYQQGRTPSISTGPKFDHTFGDDRGHYMYIEVSSGSRGAKALLESSLFSPGSGKCLEFWYHMYGSSIGQLNVYLKTGASLPSNPTWQRQKDQGNQWFIAQVPIQNIYTQMKVVFEGVRGFSYQGDIALDDIRLKDGACNQPAYCDFEKDDWCTWTNDKAEDDFDWIVGSGGTPSGYTGPSTDHTTGFGYGKYMFIEVSAPRQPGDKARLLSERFPATSSRGYCVKFWYHMYGSSIGQLNVYVKNRPGNRSENLVWSLSGNQGDQWSYGQAPVLSMSDSYQVVLEGIRGNGYSGDIAIDDITYTVGSCKVMPLSATPGSTTTPPTPTPTTPTSGGVFDCNFDVSFCQWQQDTTDSFNWTRTRGPTASSGTGPSKDHTGNGSYIYIETSWPRKPNDTARIISPMVPSSTRPGYCIKFWYHMYGPHTDTLNLYTKRGGILGNPLWTKTGNQGTEWKYAQSFYMAVTNFQFVFEGIRGSDYQGDIALDDISVTAGRCPPLTSCSFEDPQLCGYTNEPNTASDDFDWTRQSGATSSSGTGPANDHTFGTAKGYYMYIETSYPIKPGMKARLLSPRYPPTGTGKCLTFWYHMYGNHIGTLNVKVKKLFLGTPFYFLQWSRSGDHGQRWRIAQVTIRSSDNYQIAFEGISGSSYQGDIAIDDVNLTDNPCPPPGDCNFESGQCTWVNTQVGDQFDWTRNSGTTPSWQTGPSTDHTTGSPLGHYMFIETSSPRAPNDKAFLESEEFQPTGSTGRCLKFWYHMNGPDIGSLNVWISENGTRGQIWSLSGEQGNNWLYGTAPIRAGQVYQIIFEGVRSTNHKGDIAIDDVEFVVGTCPITPVNAKPTNPWTTPAPSPTATTVGPTLAPSQWDCSFETNLCSWMQAVNDNFNWTRAQGTTGSSGTGPSSDHTTGKGYYIYIETSYPRKPGEKARVESALIPATRQKCLQFWYHMYGPHVDTLNVYTKQNSALGQPVWVRNGTQGNRWRHATVDLTVPQKFQVVFEGIRGVSYAGDIAVDDVSMQDGACPPQLECTFEDTQLCGWSNVHGDNFDWTRANGRTASFGTGPSNDHTYGTDLAIFSGTTPQYKNYIDFTLKEVNPSNKNYKSVSKGIIITFSYYMYIETSSPRTKGHKAWLVSKQFTPTTGRCLQFWYHMYGNSIGALNVLLMQNSSRSSPIWSMGSNVGDVWRVAQVTLTSVVPFKVIFEGVTGTSYTGDIAIDDVEILDGQCQIPGDCNFETGTCTWFNTPASSNTDNFDWNRGSGDTFSQFTGPSTDHTTGTKAGSYMFIETSDPRKRGDLAHFESAVFRPTSGYGRCMNFFYHMNGAGIGTLNVYMRVIGRSMTKLWTQSGDHGNQWNEGQLPILSAGASYQIVFEGIRGVDYRGDIAIDDVSFTNSLSAGDCPINASTSNPWPFDCNFESDTCNWKQATNDDFDWRRYRGSTASLGTGPSEDHTGGTAQGYYIYIESSSPQSPNDTAQIISPVVSGNGTKVIRCVSFWYHMYGPHVNALNLYVQQKGVLGQPKWTKTGTQGNAWRKGEYTLITSANANIVFEGVRGSSFKGDIALDDIGISEGSCPSSGICSFESGLICGYTQDTNDKFDWTRGSGATGSSNTGPPFDHTYMTPYGHYMYLEVSGNLQQGDNARLTSVQFPGSSGSCLQFWYHMKGATIGTLNVYVKIFRFSLRKVWSKTGNQSNSWNIAQVTISSSFSFQVVFEGIRGASYTGDIAIDDVKMTSGVCPNPGDCSFEDGLCTWTNTQTGDIFDWISGSGGTTSWLTGPSTDHTTGTAQGKYMFIETSSPRNPGDTAYLVSQRFDPTTGSGLCMNFWHHMYGATIGTLNIWMAVNNTKILMWQRSGNKGDNWLQGQLQISSSTQYQIIFEGIRGSSFSGDIAIDDISFIVASSSCPLRPSDANPPGTSTTPAPPTTPSVVPTAGNTGNDCNFEVGMCKWVQDNTDQFDWTRQKGSTTSAGTGPRFDHTHGTAAGYYVFIETSYPRKPNDTARLLSAQIPQPSGGFVCLNFWYHMYGPHVDTLNIYLKTSSSRSVIWSRNGTQSDEWKNGVVQFSPSSTYQIILEGIRGISFQGDIALDDITFKDSQCPPQKECSFENFLGQTTPLCGWTQGSGSDDQFDWTRATGSTASVQTGPSNDHTYGTNKGYYMYIETSSPRKSGDKARLYSPSYPATKGSCFRFWFHMYGASIGSLQVYVKSGGTETQLWTRTRDYGNVWKVAQTTIQTTGAYQIIIEGIAGTSYQGDIAIDDLKIVDGQCPLPGDCDFEKGTCTYSQEQQEDDFDWIRGWGSTPSWKTGPSIDHTLGTKLGHYMYIEVSYPIQTGQKARFMSEDFPPISQRCVNFWFHMYGTTVGTLTLYLKTGRGNSSAVETPIWSLSGNFGDQWMNGQAPISSTGWYQIVFEGMKGRGISGDIAIDDVTYTNTRCSVLPSIAVPPTAPPTTPPPIINNCTFEQGLCSWTNLGGDQFDWTRSRGSTGSWNTGPATDHTLGTRQGYYIYIETSSPRQPNDKAWLQSGLVQPTTGNSGKCLKFWYHMYGDHVDTLNVYRTQGSSKIKIWSRTGTQGNTWRYGQVDLISTSAFNVIFEGVRGKSYMGDIALDDLDIADGACPTQTFCDFEGDTCGWTNPQGDQFDWTRDNGGTPSLTTGPSTDHTTGTNNGYYMYIETSYPRKPGDKAWFLSPTYSKTSGKCLNFYYHMSGSHIGSLNIYVKSGLDLGTKVWNMTGDQGNMWRHGRATVSSPANAYSIVFEGIRGQSYLGDIAIDDVWMEDTPCPPPGSCDFEQKSLCSWVNVKNANRSVGLDDFDWILGSGDTASYQTGPSVDHTLGTATGTYLFIETSSPRLPGDVARIQSQTFGPTTGRCFSWWFHMYGQTVDYLNVYLQYSSIL
ncbi:predicted protein [Nematostella vectensis]|uniref:Uncharacterized protein n=1 Tax=Nematostella vectensis TaxID=45351 RepID=A7RL30_NEMVE|nr:predicted protein [Nematostella vectensis]|eukprot:XP_001639850.1 predicted protein [Nematostella vectensis]